MESTDLRFVNLEALAAASDAEIASILEQGGPSALVYAAQIEDAVRMSKREILSDMKSGRVPEYVNDFGRLHDYVDANCYGGLTEKYGFHLNDHDADMAFANEVQERVHQWLKDGRPEGETPEPKREILVHLNVEVEAFDTRTPDQIADYLLACIEVGGEGNEDSEGLGTIVSPLAEEI